VLAERSDDPVERPRAEQPQRHIFPIDESVVAQLPLGLQVEEEVRLCPADEEGRVLQHPRLPSGEEAYKVLFRRRRGDELEVGHGAEASLVSNETVSVSQVLTFLATKALAFSDLWVGNYIRQSLLVRERCSRPPGRRTPARRKRGRQK
jgi:hypothetical protein